MNTPEDFEKLEKALIKARQVCPPDEYQARQNNLCQTIADHLLKPYYHSVQLEKLKELGLNEE